MKQKKTLHESVYSFRLHWQLFKKIVRKIADNKRVSLIEEQEFEKSKAMLKTKYSQMVSIQNDIGFPTAIQDQMLTVFRLQTISQLTDQKIHELQSLIQDIDQQINKWFESFQRKDIFKDKLTQKNATALVQNYVLFPLLFIGLIIVLVYLMTRLFQ